MLTNPPKRRGGGGPLDEGGDQFTNPTVANLAALIALPIGTSGTTSQLPEGWEVYVQSLRCKWRLRTTAVAPVAMEILTSTTDPTRQWWREDCLGSDANPWLPQLAWVVSPAGNDEALGTAAAPLLTFGEFERRMRGSVMNAIYSVDVRGNQTTMRSVFNLGPLGMVVLDGNNGATVAAGWPAGAQLAAAGAYTAENPAGPEWAIITANAATLPDWTAFVGRRVRVSANAFPHPAGPLDRCTFTVLQVNPAGGGNNTARITIPDGFDAYDPLLPGPTGALPANADFIYCEDLPRTGQIDFEVIKETGPVLPSLNMTGFSFQAAGPAPIALNIRARVPTALVNPLFGRPIVFGCVLDVTQCFEPINLWENLFISPGGNAQLSGRSYRELLNLIHCGFLNMTVETANCQYTGNIWHNSAMLPRPGYHDWPILNGLFDQPGGDAIRVDQPGVIFHSDGVVFGDGYNRGLYVRSVGFWWTYTVAPTLNTGGACEFRVLGVDYTWGANLPYPAAASTQDVAIQPAVV